MRRLAPTLLFAALLSSCVDDGSGVRAKLPSSLRLAALADEKKELLRATLEITGKTGEIPLLLDLANETARGDVVFAAPEAEETASAVLRLYGRADDDTAEVLLARATREITIAPGSSTPLAFSEQDWTSDGAPLFDVNRNGSSNLADLLEGHDPGVPAPFIRPSTSEVQYALDLRPGEFARQVVLVTNQAGRRVDLTATLFGAPGVSLQRIDPVAGTSTELAARELRGLSLEPFGALLLGVTFAPTNDFLVTGRLALAAVDPASRVVHTEEIVLIGNPDADPRPVPPTFVAPVLGDSADLDGFPVDDVQVFPAELLFGGIAASPQESGERAVPPLHATGRTIAGVPADAAFLVDIPARTRLSVVLSGLQTDVDLEVLDLDQSDGVVVPEDLAERPHAPGTSPEGRLVRNDGDGVRRVLILLGRRLTSDAEERAALDPDAPAAVPYSLLAQLVAGPELRSPDPLSITTGPLEGGVPVEIFGFGFQQGARVRFGDAFALDAVVSEDGARIAATLPPGPPAGAADPVSVVVQNPGPDDEPAGDGESATLPEAFTYQPPAPRIDALVPSVGSTLGGTPVRVLGAFFARRGGLDPEVLFDGAPAVDVRFVDASTLEVVAPAHAEGPVNVSVRNHVAAGAPVSEDVAANAFYFVVPSGDPPAPTGIDPAAGSVDGDDAVTITGTGFAEGAVVLFGGTQASAVNVASATTLTLRTPPRAPGTVDVRVVNPDGQTGALPAAWTYETPAPSLALVEPDYVSALGGTRLTIDGTGFREGSVAAFEQGQASVPAAATLFVSRNRLVVTAPSGLIQGAASLLVQNPDGKLSSPFTVDVRAPLGPPPLVTGVAPAAVGTDGGDPVVVSGTGFVSARVFLGESEVVLTTQTANALSFVAPPNGGPGSLILRVLNADGQSASTVFTYLPTQLPSLTGVSPAVAHALVPGDRLLLSGANLAPLDGVVATIEGPGGAVFTAQVGVGTSTSVPVTVTSALPDEDELRVALAYPGGHVVRSPFFAAIAPTAFSLQVVDGQPKEGGAFSVLVQGANMNPEHLVDARLVDDRGTASTADDLVASIGLSLKTESLVRADVTAAAPLLQGRYAVSLRYDNGHLQPVLGRLVVSGNCGNAVLEPGEECDGGDFGGETCADRGFFGGQLSCDPVTCRIQTLSCNACGNGLLDPNEECDGQNLGGATCTSLGFDGGELFCDPATCRFDALSCSICGNGIREPAEECEPNDFGGETCSTLGFNGGSLSCSGTCGIVAGACFTCGDARCSDVETNATCATDCPTSCGNGVCDASETCTSCPRDCSCTGPFTLTLVSGDGQSGGFSRDLATPFVVRAADGLGAPLRGVQVRFSAPAGALVSPATALTDANGHASTLLTLGRETGAQLFTAEANAPDGTLLSGAPVVVTATSTDVATGIVVTLANQAGVRGRPTLPAPASKSALDVDFSSRSDVEAAPDGTLYVSDTRNNRVVKIDPQGTMTVVAGTGAAGNTGDNGPAVQATLNHPRGLALDAAGNLYVVDGNNNRVRRVDTDGFITAFAGGNPTQQPNNGDGLLATQANLAFPSGIAVDPAGNVFVVSDSHDQIRRIDAASGIISTAVQGGQGCSTDDPRPSDIFGDVDFDPQGRLVFIATVSNIGGCPVPSGVGTVMRRNADGSFSVIAGGSNSGDGIAAFGAALNVPIGLAVDVAGNVFVVEGSAHRVRKASVLGVITTVAGTGVRGFSGDGGAATSAQLDFPHFAAMSPAGDLLFVDGSSTVRMVRGVGETTAPTLQVAVLGGAQSAPVNRTLVQPIGVRVTDASGAAVAGVRVRATPSSGAATEPSSGFTDANGTVTFLASLGRKPGTYTFVLDAFGIDGLALPGSPFTVTATATDVADGTILSVLNQRGTPGAGSTSGSAARSLANLDTAGVAIDPVDGSIYFSDTFNDRVMRIDPNGALHRVAGTGLGGFTGDGFAATNAQLNDPHGLALDAAGNLYIADHTNDRVRVVRTDGTIATFAGGGPTSSNDGDGLVSNSANLDGPRGLAVDPNGDLLIVDDFHNKVRRVDVETPGEPGVISTLVQGALSCTANNPQPSDIGASGLAFDRSGRLYFVATISNGGGCPVPGGQFYVFRRQAQGVYEIVAGGSTTAETGPAFGTNLANPGGLAVDSGGNLYVSEPGRSRIRKVDVLGRISTVVGSGTSGFGGDYGAATAALLSQPSFLAFDPAGDLLFSDAGAETIRAVRGLDDPSPVTATIRLVSGDAQSAVIGQVASLPLRVVVEDGDGTPIPGLPVTFQALNPGDFVQQRFSNTASTGETTTTVRLGRDAVGAHGFVARAKTWLDPADLAGSPVAFGATATRPASGSVVALVNSFGVGGRAALPLPSTQAQLNLETGGIAVDVDGTLFLSDTFNDRVLMISPEGDASVFAGNGSGGFSGDFGAALLAQLNDPRGLALDASGRLYIADAANGRVRRVNTDGTIETYAGGAADSVGHGDGGVATGANLNFPTNLTVGPDGALYITDDGHNNIRRVDPATQIISTFLGAASCTTNNVQPSDFQRTQVVFDGAGRAYFKSFVSNGGGCPLAGGVEYVFRREANGTFTAVTGSAANTADGQQASATRFFGMAGFAFTAAGDLLVVENGSHRIRRIPGGEPTGIVSTVAGTGTAGFATLSPPGSAPVNGPALLAVDPLTGDVYFSEDGNDAVRMIVAP